MNTEFKNIAEYGFIRPHIGYAVNNKYGEYISADCILLQNNINIPLNKKYRDDTCCNFQVYQIRLSICQF